MIRFRSTVAMIAALGALILAPAAAQAADFQVYRDAVCAASRGCAIDFLKVPAGKKLTIVNFSCYLRFSSSNNLGAAQLVLLNPDGSRAFAVTPNFDNQDEPQIGEASQTVFTANETIRAVANPGQRFRAYAQVYDRDGAVGTIAQLSCHISGTLI